MKKRDQYYSVEFSLDPLPVPYQFRIWDIKPKSMLILIREDSAILPLLKVGDRLKMKYYSADSHYPDTEGKETAITEITKDEKGRFKGHFLVGLDII